MADAHKSVAKAAAQTERLQVRQVVGGDMFARFRLACFVAVIPYGFTESCFNRLSPIWFLLLITIIDGVSMRVRGKNKQATVESNTSEGAFVRQF